jgi:hypothetical protein
MSASALLDELLNAGIRVRREGEDLLVDVLPEASLDSYREHIQKSKPALLAELRAHEEPVTSGPYPTPQPVRVSTAPVATSQSHPCEGGGLDAATAFIPQLEEGWRWLTTHPSHPEHESFFARWVERLRQYERSYTAVCAEGNSCRLS